MSGAWRIYSGEIQKNLDYRATWLPDSPRSIGDVGKLVNDQYELVTTLKNLGVPFSTRRTKVGGEYRYTTAGAVTFGANVDARDPSVSTPLLDVQGAFQIGFNRASAVALLATDCGIEVMENLDQIEKEVLRRLRFEDWNPSFVIVTEVVRAGSTTALVSGERGGSLVVKGRSNVGVGPASMDLFKAGVDLVRADNMALSIIAQGDLAPLFRVHGVRKGLLQSGRFVRRSGESTDEVVSAKRRPEERLGEIPFGLDD